MACETQTDKFVQIVEKLLSIDANKYKNFDNVAEFVLKGQNLSPEQKKLALHHTAHIYSGLHGLDAETFQLGKAEEVIKNVVKIDDTAEYMNAVNEMFKAKAPSEITQAQIDAKVQAFTRKTRVTIPDLIGTEGILPFINMFLKTSVFATPESKAEFIKSISADLKEIIGKMETLQEGSKQGFYAMIDNYFSTSEENTGSYIRLSEVQEYTGLDNFMLLLDNNMMVEAVKIEELFYVTNSDGQLEAVDPERIVMSKLSRPYNAGLSNKGEQIFFPDEITSGLHIEAVNPDESAEIIKRLDNMASPSSGIKVTAVKISDAGDMRVNKIQQLAKDEPKAYGALKNRKHETFESPAQEAILQSSPDAKVVSVSRPKASEQQFALMGNIVGTDLYFYIYSFENFTFVSSDNTTELLDFENPGHLEDLRKLSLVEEGGMRRPLTNAELLNIQHSQRVYSEFKAKLADRVNEQFSKGENGFDVTTEFLDTYSMSQTRPEGVKVTPLNKAIENDGKNLGLTLEVVQVSSTGEIIEGSEKTTHVPFVYRKNIDHITADVSYSLLPMLPSDFYIKVTDDEGNVSYVTQEAYAQNNLKMSEFLESHFKKTDDDIKQKLSSENIDPEKRKRLSDIPKQNFFVISFSLNPVTGAVSTMKTLSAEPRYYGSDALQFANYLGLLSQSLYQGGMKIAPQQRAINMKKFERGLFSFRGSVRTTSGGFSISTTLATSKSEYKKQEDGSSVNVGSRLQLELRPFSGTNDQNSKFYRIFQEQGKNPFNFEFSEEDEALIAKMSAEMTNGSLVKKVVQDNPSLESYDRNTSEGLMSFYQAAAFLNETNAGSPSITEMFNDAESKMKEFSQIIKRNVIDKITSGEKGSPAFLELLKEEFTFNGVFRPEALLFEIEEDGSLTPKINVLPTNPNFESFVRSSNSVSIVTKSSKRFSLTPKQATAVSANDAAAVSKKPLVKPSLTKQERAQADEVARGLIAYNKLPASDAVQQTDSKDISQEAMTANVYVHGQYGDVNFSETVAGQEMPGLPSTEETAAAMRENDETLAILETSKDGKKYITVVGVKDSEGNFIVDQMGILSHFAVSIELDENSSLTADDVMMRLESRINQIDDAVLENGFMQPEIIPSENFKQQLEDTINSKIDDILDESESDPNEDADADDFFRFSIDPNVVPEQARRSVKGFVRSVYDKYDKFKEALKSQGADSVAAYNMMIEALKNKKPLTAEEKTFIGDQLKDALKMAGFGMAAVIPGGSVYFLLAKSAKLKEYLVPTHMLTKSQLPATPQVTLDPNIQPASEWLSGALPMFELNTSDLQDVVDLSKIDGRVLGLFKDRVIYLNNTLLNKGTIYHEAFHGVFRYLMTKEERDKLVSSVVSNKKYASRFTQQALEEFARVRKFRYDHDAMVQLVAEEILADGFQRYAEKAETRKTAPKTMLQKFFDMLRKLINLFVKNQDYIENTYSKIHSGGFSHAVIKTDFYKGQVAFEILHGPMEYYNTESGAIQKNVSELQSREAAQLIDMVVSEVIRDNTSDDFNKKFVRATDNILANIYNMDVLASQVESEADKEYLQKTYGPMYQKFRFILGARFKGLEGAGDVNNTDDAAYSDKSSKNMIFRVGQEPIDNTLGKHSFQTLAKEVKRKLDAINTMKLIREDMSEDDNNVTYDDVEKSMSEEVLNEKETDKADVLEELDSADFDKSFNEFDLTDSYVAQVRRFLSTIRRDRTDERTGVQIPEVIDGQAIFNVLLQISSGKDPYSIMSLIDASSAMLEKDGYTEVASDLKQVYASIVELTKMDAEGTPTSNQHLYNQIINVLHSVEIDYMMINVTMPENITDLSDLNAMARQKPVSFRIVDRVLESSIVQKRNEIISGLIKAHTEKARTDEYFKAYQALVKASEAVSTPGNVNIFGALGNHDVSIRNLTNEIHGAMTTLGMKVPRSLVELSLMAIQATENSQPLTLGKQLKAFYDGNQEFIKQGQYLQKDFFSNLATLMKNNFYSGPKVPKAGLDVILDDETTKDSAAMIMSLILKKATAYVIKYDPTNLPSVIKNAEGKAIYRFTKPTPFTEIARSVRENGLLKTLEQNPYHKDFLMSFFEDNFMLGDILKGEDTEKAKRVKLLLENYKAVVFGGAQQIQGGVYGEGKTFSGLDPRSLYLLSILSFMNRDTVRGKDGTEIQTYMKSHHQLEATSTNFLFTALYENFVNTKESKVGNTKGHVRYQGKYLKIVEDLQAVVKQEYNRIKREWARKDDVKAEYDKGEKNTIVNNYNGKLNPDGKTANTDSESLRAYKFNVLDDFFSTNSEFQDSLAQAAKENKDFDSLDNEFLLEALNEYAQESFDQHLQNLVKVGLIEQVEQKIETPLGTETAVYYTSEFIPKEFKTNLKGKSQSVAEAYPKSVYFGAGKKLSEQEQKVDAGRVEALLFDSFMNFWKNSLHFNQIFDGDIALNVKNFQDYVKRLKKSVASGDNMKRGTHRVAFMNTVTAFVHEDFPQYGPYMSIEEIENDWKITDNEVREKIKSEYEIGIANPKSPQAEMFREIFDGQTISTLMHQADQFNSIGRLDERALNIIIAKHYRALTQDEVKYLKSMKIVLNAKKTVTAGPNAYIKSSESYIDRKDVSYIVMPKNATAEQIQNIHEQLHNLYLNLYSLRQDRQRELIADKESDIADIDTAIADTVEKIHSFYRPLPHREMMHNLLNSMEFFQVDQLADTTASKNATVLPVDVFKADRVGSYINLGLSSVDLNNSEKYFQVETSGVKDYAKISVQKKLLMMADLAPEHAQKVMEAIAKKEERDLTESELNSILTLKDVFEAYQDSMKESLDGRLEYFKNILRNGSDFEVGKIFDIIRENLEAQGAPKNILDYFSTDVSGRPVFSPNLSIVRNTLEYYFMAQYSKNVTDEKGFGFKSFHESSFGQEVLENMETGDVIFTEEIARDPSKYSDKTRYKARPLTTSYDAETNTYWAEVIIPKPQFENAEHEAFWKENISKMFGTRIPTEDKRSMVALKVVDFVDGAKSNNIIVPHFVHMLSGSDFDIDSLFGQMYAHYRNGAGKYSVYGEYSQYENENSGKFIEFLHFMSQNSDFKALIKKRKEELKEEGGIELTENSPVLQIINALGFTQEDLDNAFNIEKLKTQIQELKSDAKEVYALKEEAKEEYLIMIRETEQNPDNREAWSLRTELGAEIAGYHAEMTELNQQRKSLREQKERARNLIRSVYEYKALTDVFIEKGIPVTAKDFSANPSFEKMVVTKAQNKNLTATLDVLTNEAVFNRLWINQRSSTQAFKNLLEKYGIDLKKITKKGNLYTMDNFIMSKGENSMNKDGIGITAVMNKFLAMASQYDLELSDKNIIWKYLDKDGKLVEFKKYGTLNANNDRVIELIGNILGMFADGAKDPIPAALQWNEINAGTTLNMIGIGLNPEMAVAFNFLPEVRKASLAVQQSKFAISSDVNESYLFFNNAIKNELQEFIQANPESFENLKKLGLISKSSWAGKMEISTKDMVVEHSAKPVDMLSLENDALTSEDVGFSLSTKDGTGLTESEARIMLLAMYQAQAQQSWSVNKVAKISNMFKRLNPSFVAFDKMKEAVMYTRSEEGLFTEDSVARMFDDKVWNSVIDIINDLNNQASKLFLERTPFFSPVVSTFSNLFEDKKKIAQTIVGFVSLQKMLKVYPGSRKAPNAAAQAIVNEDDANFLKTFTPDYWFTHGLARELDKMREMFPGNEFLKILREAKTDKTANIVYDGKTYVRRESYLKVLNKAKIKGDYANRIVNDLNALYNNHMSRMFVKKLFYHELARTGNGNAYGSFLQYMPAELQAPVSNYVEEFITSIRELSEKVMSMEDVTTTEAQSMMMDTIKGFLGEGTKESDVYNFFNEMLMQIAYSATQEKNNTRIKQPRNLRVAYNPKKPESTPAFISALPEFEENPKDAVERAKKLISEVFTSKTDSETGKVTYDDLSKTTTFVFDPKNIGETFTIDGNPESFTDSESFNAIANLLGRVGINFSEDIGQFEFPLMYKIAGKTYLLKAVDSKDPDASLGKSIYEGISGGMPFVATGISAVYEAIPENYTSEGLNPAGFNSESARRYQALISKKESINMGERPVTETTQSEAGVVPTDDFGQDMPSAEELAATNALLAQFENMSGSKSETDISDEERETATGVEVDDATLALLLGETVKTSTMSTPEAPLQIYSDGSDIKGTGKLGFGAVFTHNEKDYSISGTEASPEIKRLSQKHPEAKFSNPTMEMMALVSVLNAFKNTKEHIEINQDYNGAVNYDALWYYSEGSAQRANKPWKAKEPYIKTLVDAATTLIKQIESNGGSVKIKWVKGHSGNIMNDKADAAAKNREIMNTFKQALVENGAVIVKPKGLPGIDLSDQDNCG